VPLHFGYNPIVTFGRMVWLTGIVALITTDQDVEGQTLQALTHMDMVGLYKLNPV
jgi:enamine deaminase RidA (YjgF/YER057c/UK114 family)